MAQRIKLFRHPLIWATIPAILLLLLVSCSAFLPDLGDNFISEPGIDRLSVEIDLNQPFTLSYLRAGDQKGQRVIFVHGTPGSADNWLDILRMVPKGYEFFAVDRPGFGLTLPEEDVTSLDLQAKALEPLLTGGNGKPALLVGHSLGGPVIAAAAANYPDHVGGILQVAGALDPGLEEVQFIQHLGNTWLVSWAIPRWARNANRELIDLEGELLLLEPKLPTIEQPVTIIHGTKDELVPYANVPFMAKTMTSSAKLKIVKLEGQNHFLPWNSTQIIFDEIMAMADMLEAREPAGAAAFK